MKLAVKISKIANEHKKIAFVVKTPGSTGDLIQTVMLRDFMVKKTRDGNFIVVGRDACKEWLRDLETGYSVQKRRHRVKAHQVIRSYRLDRIYPRTIIAG
jgi:hypothetical protein